MASRRSSPFRGNISFNAQHSPMGAFASFTCGHFGTRGGIAAQIGSPGNQDLYIGVKDGSRLSDAPLRCLPFFKGAGSGAAGAADFLVEQAGPTEQNAPAKVIPLRREQLERYYGWATDQWVSSDFTFTIYSPFGEIPDPGRADLDRVRDALLPAVIAELDIDNTRGTQTRTAFFAIGFNQPGWLPLDMGSPTRAGFSLKNQVGVLAQVVQGGEEKPALFCRWTPDQGLMEPAPHLLGSCPGVCVEVPAGQHCMLRIAIGCYIPGIATTGHEGSYLYTRYFTSLHDVLSAALDRGNPRPASQAIDERLLESDLSPDQQFQIAHATRSYYGSTQLLDVGGKPFWVVNEGEYCMMNTLDLCVDQMFWELKHNPWVVRNLLDNFVRHYSYVDALKAGGNRTIPGGISFTHDMGAHNNFSPDSHSSYELPELSAKCFSYMTAEQLCNWVLMATTYVLETGDINWARQNSHMLLACLESLRNRGGVSGIPEFDSTRCGQAGAEITTYDSLDHSLAQTRNNFYMAVKFWASFRGLAAMFKQLGASGDWNDARIEAVAFAERAAETLTSHAGTDGVIPAVFERNNDGYHSRILPGVEALLYPFIWGEDTAGEAPALHAALRKHTLALLKDSQRRNLFPDGGIKLSSTSNNSWMSKIAIFMHVAREILRVDEDAAIAELFERADAAHVKWQTDGSGYWACSDQFVSGVAKGSRYYPRVVTSALWMNRAQSAEPVKDPLSGPARGVTS
jgi:xylan 1,4-beta-xylosidase